MVSVATAIASRTLGSGPCTVSLLASLIAPERSCPGVGGDIGQFGAQARGHPAKSRAVVARPGPALDWLCLTLSAMCTLSVVQEACQSGRMGLTANELSPYRGPEVQILRLRRG